MIKLQILSCINDKEKNWMLNNVQENLKKWNV